MQISPPHTQQTEHIWLNMFVTGNEFVGLLALDEPEYNLRGAMVCLDRSVAAGDAPVGARCTIGAPTGVEQRFAIGPLQSDMWVNSRPADIDQSAQPQLIGRWILVTIYGFMNRIWTRAQATPQDLLLTAVPGGISGAFNTARQAASDGLQKLTGQIIVNISAVPAQVKIDLDGTDRLDDGTDNINATVAYGSTFGRDEPAVTRNKYNDTINANVQATLPGPAARVVGYLMSQTALQVSEAILKNQNFANFLNNPQLTAGSNWRVDGDFALTANVARYTHSSGAGTLRQFYQENKRIETDSDLNRVITFETGKTYEITYTISNMVAGPQASLGLNMGVFLPVNLTMANGTHTTTFTNFLQSWHLVIDCTSAAGSFDIDNIAIREVNVPWTVTADFSIDPVNERADYAHGSGAGTLTQASSQFELALEAGKSYVLDVTFSGVAGSPTLNLSGIVDSPVAITVANGTQQVRFTVSNSPGNFVLTGASGGGDAFSITTLNLRRYATNDVTDQYTVAPANIAQGFVTNMGLGGQGA